MQRMETSLLTKIKNGNDALKLAQDAIKDEMTSINAKFQSLQLPAAAGSSSGVSLSTYPNQR